MKKSKHIGKKKPFYKKKQFFTYLIGIFIIMLMVLSVVSLDSNEDEAIEYNDLKFVASASGYLAYTEDKEQIIILTNPTELLELESTEITLNSLVTLEKIYISLNPTDNYQNAVYDLTRNIALPTQQVLACHEDNELCTDLPLRTCEDATETQGIILFKEDNETLLSFNDNCLTIQGKDLLKLTDKLILDQNE
jgi:hypothetical protein